MRPYALTCMLYILLCLLKGWFHIFCILPNVFTTSGKILQPATTLFILSFLYRSLSQGCLFWTKHWKRFRVHRLMGQSNSRKKRGLFCITVKLITTCYRTTERKSLKHFWLLQWWKSGVLKRVRPSLVPFDFWTVFTTETAVCFYGALYFSFTL